MTRVLNGPPPTIVKIRSSATSSEIRAETSAHRYTLGPLVNFRKCLSEGPFKHLSPRVGA
jgi:hypothetical protein